MAEKITWAEPTEDTITSVEISKSSTLYGTYSVIVTIDATSDGEAKSSSNEWSVNYTYSSGLRTDWYKIRFYDSSTALYSEYSDPTTSEELLRLCTVDDVKDNIETVGRWTDDEIFDTITKVDNLVYIEFGTPIQSSWSEIGKIDSTVQTMYYVGEENIHRVDRVFYGTTTKQELFLDDGYKVNNTHGMVDILPVASSGITPDVDCDIEIHYVPRIFNDLSVYRTIKRLLEKSDLTSSGTTSKELEVIKERLKEVETLIANRFCLQVSSKFKNYDTEYKVNSKKIIQNHDRNLFLSAYGW